MWSLSNRVADKVRRSAARKWHTRGKRQDFRQPRLEALEARVVLSGGVFVQPLGPTTIGPSTVGDDFPRASFVDGADRIVVAGNYNASPTGTNVDSAAFRFTSGGIPDASFSGDGIATIDVSSRGI